MRQLWRDIRGLFYDAFVVQVPDYQEWIEQDLREMAALREHRRLRYWWHRR